MSCPSNKAAEKLSLATANITETVCPNAKNKLICLREADFEALNNEINAALSLQLPRAIYRPAVDGDIFVRSRVQQLRDGDFVQGSPYYRDK